MGRGYEIIGRNMGSNGGVKGRGSGCPADYLARVWLGGGHEKRCSCRWGVNQFNYPKRLGRILCAPAPAGECIRCDNRPKFIRGDPCPVDTEKVGKTYLADNAGE